MPWAVEFYEDEAGGRPVEKFFEQLPKQHLGKVLQVLQMLEERGPHLPFSYSSQVEGRLRELRVYYGDARRTFVLLHTFEKRTQALPPAEVALAMRRMARDEERKAKSQ